jgi:hypothetical protein
MAVTFYSPSAPTRVVVEPATLAGGWTSWVEVVVPAPGVPEAYLHVEVAEAVVGLLGLDRWAESDDQLVGLVPAAAVTEFLERAEATIASADVRAPWLCEGRITRARPTVVVEPGGLHRLVPGRVVAIEWAVTDEHMVAALAGVRAVLGRAAVEGWSVSWG